MFQVASEYNTRFVVIVGCMEKMKAKDWDRRKAPQVQSALVLAGASLETTLPVYWNKQNRHMLLCQFVKVLNDFGSFWAIVMLWIEYYHTLGTCVCVLNFV
jgi:hypothetical protein